MTDQEEEAEVAREVMDRAIRRLNVLEYLILLLALVLALLGGALVAWALSTLAGVSFRLTWVVASLLLFVLPGGAVYLREHGRIDPASKSSEQSETKEANG